MKIGIISDVHGNIDALNAVLKEFDKEKIDKIICCGDIIGIGPKPEEVVQELIKKKDILTIVRGNHEQYLLEGPPKQVHDEKRPITLEEEKNHRWTHSQITESSKEFISQFETSNIMEIENKKICVVHYPSDENGIYKKHIKSPTIEQSKEMFNQIDADIFIYGHTHTITMNKVDNKWYINPGSLGCPLKSNIANAGILEIDNDEIHYKQIEVEYDVDKVIKEIERLRFPYYKELLRIFYGTE